MIQMRREGRIDCPANFITESDQGWLCGVIEIFKGVPDLLSWNEGLSIRSICKN